MQDRKIVEYKLVSWHTADEPKEVNSLLDEGWVPAGTIAVFDEWVYQPMIKFED